MENIYSGLDYIKDELVMTVHVGYVTEPEEIDSVQTALNSSPIITFKDGVRIGFSWTWLANIATKFKEKYENEHSEERADDPTVQVNTEGENWLKNNELANIVVLIAEKCVDLSSKTNRTEYEEGCLNGMNDALRIIIREMKIVGNCSEQGE